MTTEVHVDEEPNKISLADSLVNTPNRCAISIVTNQQIGLPFSERSLIQGLRDHSVAIGVASFIAFGIGSLGARVYHDRSYVQPYQTVWVPQAVPTVVTDERNNTLPKLESKPFVLGQSDSDYIKKAYLELVLPITAGSSVAEMMADMGYTIYFPLYIPDDEYKFDKLQAGKEGNKFRKLPLKWEKEDFLNKFMTENIKGSANAGDPISNLAIAAVTNPDGSINFWNLDPRGWVSIADKIGNESVEWNIENPGGRIEAVVETFKIPAFQGLTSTKV